MSVSRGCSGCLRANARSCLVRSAPRDGGLVDHAADCCELGLAGNALGQQFHGTDDHGEQVVEVMGHPAGELADRIHLLRLAQLLLEAQALTDIAPDDDDQLLTAGRDAGRRHLCVNPIAGDAGEAQLNQPGRTGRQQTVEPERPGGVGDGSERASDHVFPGPPQHDGGGAVRLDHQACLIEHQDGVMGLLHQKSNFLFRLLSRSEIEHEGDSLVGGLQQAGRCRSAPEPGCRPF